MAPSPTFNWLCVFCSAADILAHAAQIRAANLLPKASRAAAIPIQKKLPSHNGIGIRNTPSDDRSTSDPFLNQTSAAGNMDLERNFPYQLESSEVPSSRIGRFFHYGGA
jgi:hypothetical protein